MTQSIYDFVIIGGGIAGISAAYWLLQKDAKLKIGIIEKNKIAQIKQVGYPGVPIDPKSRPKLNEGDKELDCTGMYLMPGFIDMHGHIGGKSQGTPAEYVFKLWLAHGITTIRDPSAGNGLDWTLDQKRRSEKNEITAPRIKAYTAFGMGSDKPITTPEEARQWVRDNAAKGADGIKFFGAEPAVFSAAQWGVRGI